MEEALQKLDAFFNPRSVAIIGATKKVDKAGHVIFKNFSTNKMRGVFKGELYPVNPNEDSILGFKCYPSLTHIPDEVDLIVIIVPANVVPSIMEEAVAKKVKAAIIISSGFKEVGNAELEEQVVAIAKKGGIRVLGPNCLGVYYSKTGIDSSVSSRNKNSHNRRGSCSNAKANARQHSDDYSKWSLRRLQP